MKLLLSPHNDDECLFAAYTLMREKPLVIIVTDSNAQLDKGVTAEMRREESRRGCEALGVAVVFLGLKDGSLKENEADLRERLAPFASLDWKRVYAPSVQGGHDDHDAVGEVASSMFTGVSYYSTYAEGEHFTPEGKGIEPKPTQAEIDLKNKALDCYVSQIGIIENKRHFDAVRGKSEFLIHTRRP
jgi:LmbE family N-acetylglucosaminyl deacetylase